MAAPTAVNMQPWSFVVLTDGKVMDDLAAGLHIPQKVIPLNVVVIGVPAGQEKPVDKYKKEKIHWEQW